MSKTLAKFGLAALAIASLSTEAFAHAHLKSSVPADKSTVAAPQELDLTFSEELNLKFTGVKVTGPNKSAIKTGDAMLMDGKVGLMVPVSEKLGPGTYDVEWHALSADGHKTSGTFTFTVKP
jgi:methionine-rich copper-binding protein CopC